MVLLVSVFRFCSGRPLDWCTMEFINVLRGAGREKVSKGKHGAIVV